MKVINDSTPVAQCFAGLCLFVWLVIVRARIRSSEHSFGSRFGDVVEPAGWKPPQLAPQRAYFALIEPSPHCSSLIKQIKSRPADQWRRAAKEPSFPMRHDTRSPNWVHQPFERQPESDVPAQQAAAAEFDALSNLLEHIAIV